MMADYIGSLGLLLDMILIILCTYCPNSIAMNCIKLCIGGGGISQIN